MKLVYEITKVTEYNDAVYDKDLQVNIKDWYTIQQKYTGLGVVQLSIDKRNFKKIHPLMLLYKFTLAKGGVINGK